MAGKSSKFNIYKQKGRVPVGVALPFGLQHVLAMLVSNMTPVILIGGVCGITSADLGRLIQSSMIIAGIGTLIQLFPLWKIGGGLPAVSGVSFTFVTVLLYIGATHGFSYVLGAALVGGVLEGVLGLLAVFWVRFISPVVAACVVTSLGFSLFTVGAKSFGGGDGAVGFGSWQNWVVGSVTLLICLILSVFAKGIIKTLSVLIGLVAGYVLALCLGMVDFSSVTGSSIVGLPYFSISNLRFDVSTIISVCCIYLVAATDTIGNCEVLTTSAMNRSATTGEIGGAVACNGFVSALGALFGCLPVTTYAQNTGLVAMNKVINRMAIGSGAIFLVLAGFFPMLGSLLASIPQPVFGGCSIMMFGMIVVSGIGMLADCGFSERNKIIISLSLSIGIGFTQIPSLFNIFSDSVKNIFAENCVAMVFILAIVLDFILPGRKISSDDNPTGLPEAQDAQGDA